MDIGVGYGVSVENITNTSSAKDLHSYMNWLYKFYPEQYSVIDNAPAAEAANMIKMSLGMHLREQRELLRQIQLPEAERNAAQYNVDMMAKAANQLPQIGELSTNYAATIKRAEGYGITVHQMNLLDDVARNVNGETNYSQHVEKIMSQASAADKNKYVQNVLNSVEQGGKDMKAEGAVPAIVWGVSLGHLKKGGYAEQAKAFRHESEQLAQKRSEAEHSTPDVKVEASPKKLAVQWTDAPSLEDIAAGRGAIGMHMQGESVTAVQEMLLKVDPQAVVGTKAEPHKPDSQSADNMKTAISQFQRGHELPDTGVLDKDTLASLKTAAADVDQKAKISNTIISQSDLSSVNNQPPLSSPSLPVAPSRANDYSNLQNASTATTRTEVQPSQPDRSSLRHVGAGKGHESATRTDPKTEHAIHADHRWNVKPDGDSKEQWKVEDKATHAKSSMEISATKIGKNGSSVTVKVNDEHRDLTGQTKDKSQTIAMIEFDARGKMIGGNITHSENGRVKQSIGLGPDGKAQDGQQLSESQQRMVADAQQRHSKEMLLAASRTNQLKPVSL